MQKYCFRYYNFIQKVAKYLFAFVAKLLICFKILNSLFRFLLLL